MKRPKTIKLGYGERIIAVVPERCAGPGWSNAPIWVYIRTNAGDLREECIQPDERTSDMHVLFGPGAAMAEELLRAVPVRKAKMEAA
jgi:hypothetical protein